MILLFLNNLSDLPNLIHLVFDNQSHESTGGQPSNTRNIDLYKIAKSSNYKAFKTNSKIGLQKILRKILDGFQKKDTQL